MESKIVMPESVCRDEVIDYMASRYSISPEQVIEHFMRQDGIINTSAIAEKGRRLFEENEMEILRDMGIRPSRIEFSKK